MKLSINFFSNQRDLKTFGAALLASSILAITATANDFELKWSTEGVELSEGDKKVFFYQRATKSQDGKYPRANYLHPLYDLDGAVITDDFPKDHPHHAMGPCRHRRHIQHRRKHTYGKGPNRLRRPPGNRIGRDALI